MNEQFLFRVFKATAPDLCDTIWWREWEGALKIFVNCNDLFYWACADLEDLTPDNIDLFEQSIKDIRNLNIEKNYFGPLLYCARARKMRPQKPYYEYMPEPVKELFDACGPERDV